MLAVLKYLNLRSKCHIKSIYLKHTTARFILYSISHKGFEAGASFARHDYSGPAKASQPTEQPPRLIINRDGQFKVTAMINIY